MNVHDCRFYCPPPQHNRQKVFREGLLERSKTYSGSCLLPQNPRIGRAGWELKQLARDVLRKPEVMAFIGSCLEKSPDTYGMLLCEPDIKALYEVAKEAGLTSPEGKADIIHSAGMAIALMKMRNKLLFEGPVPAFGYYETSNEAKIARACLKAEIREIRMGLHDRGRFIFHPKTVELHRLLKERIYGRCLILCESREQSELLYSLGRKALVDVSTDPQAAELHTYAHLVLYSPTTRLREAIKKFRGDDVIILAMNATWEEGAYWHYVSLEMSRKEKQGSLGLDVPTDQA